MGLFNFWKKRTGRAEDFTPLLEQVHAHLERQEFDGALAAARQACDLARACFGEVTEEHVLALYLTAMVHERQGNEQEAESVYRRALEIGRPLLPEDDTTLANILILLGLIYVGRHEFARAEPLFREALANRRKSLGNSHPELSLFLANLA
jgi:tetratricopeptide (TPR) repeat protein